MGKSRLLISCVKSFRCFVKYLMKLVRVFCEIYRLICSTRDERNLINEHDMLWFTTRDLGKNINEL